jgi:hypothetical protein
MKGEYTMKIQFRDITECLLKARVSKIEKKEGIYGPYVRFIFTVIEGDWLGYKFSATVSLLPLRQGNLYKWISNMLGETPEDDFVLDGLLDKICWIGLSLRNTGYCYVSKVYPAKDETSTQYNPFASLTK